MHSETSEDLQVELDAVGRVVYLDADGAAILGLDASVALGQDWFGRFVAEEDRVAHRAEFLAFIDTKAYTPMSVQASLVAPEGKVPTLWHVVGLRDAQGNVTGARLSGAMLTRPRGDALMLRDALKRLHDLRYAIDQASIMAITDRQGVIVQVNDTFTAISGYSREALVGQTHRIINSGHHPPSFFKEMWATIGRGQVWRGDVCNRARDGHLYWVATTIVPLVDSRGRPYQYLALRNEITERKAAEAALARTITELERSNGELALANRRILEEHRRMLQAEKLSSVGLLAAGVAHEINNPLAGVMGCVKALRDGKVNEARRDTYFETVIDGLERMQGIVQALLNYARPAQPTRTAVHLPEVVDACMILLMPQAHKRQTQLLHRVPEKPPQVEGDRGQLMQAVMNVLINAVHASPPQTDIVVEYHEDVAHGRTGLVIRDMGPGIPPELIARVTDPFFSTKPEGQGTGLGLSVTLGIVQAHGGELQIESPPPGTDPPAAPEPEAAHAGGARWRWQGPNPPTTRPPTTPKHESQGPGTAVTLWLRTWLLA